MRKVSTRRTRNPGLSKRNISTQSTVQNTRGKEHPNRVGTSEHDEGHQCAHNAENKHGFAAIFVREGADNWYRNELGDRVRSLQPSKLSIRHVKLSSHVGEERKNEREAENIDENEEEERKEGRHFGRKKVRNCLSDFMLQRAQLMVFYREIDRGDLRAQIRRRDEIWRARWFDGHWHWGEI